MIKAGSMKEEQWTGVNKISARCSKQHTFEVCGATFDFNSWTLVYMCRRWNSNTPASNETVGSSTKCQLFSALASVIAGSQSHSLIGTRQEAQIGHPPSLLCGYCTSQNYSNKPLFKMKPLTSPLLSPLIVFMFLPGTMSVSHACCSASSSVWVEETSSMSLKSPSLESHSDPV